MHEFLSSQYNDKELEPDFKYAGVWMGDDIVVTWDINEEKFIWDSEVAMSNGIDEEARHKAEKHTEKK